MKQSSMLEPSLREFQWEEMFHLHLDICYCRHRLIQKVNDSVARNTFSSVEDLDALAKVEEKLKAAADGIEAAKGILFDLCYESSDQG